MQHEVAFASVTAVRPVQLNGSEWAGFRRRLKHRSSNEVLAEGKYLASTHEHRRERRYDIKQADTSTDRSGTAVVSWERRQGLINC